MTKLEKEQREIARLEKASAFHQHKNYFLILIIVLSIIYIVDELASSVVKSYGIRPGSQIILSAGYPTGEGSANFMKIITVK